LRAVVLTELGGPEHLELREVPDPAAGPGQVIVRLAATSVNPADVKIRRGGGPLAPDLPGILGMDVAGVVESVGEGVTGFREGDAVYGCAGGLRGLPGALAERMAADARLLAPKPDALTFREAAALPLVSITAWEALYDRAELREGEHVLVFGGTGGVGHVGVQLARARGARVAATVSSEEKARLARELGAEDIIDYRRETPASYLERLTGGEGFDVVFDTVGGDNLSRAMEAAGLTGRVSTVVARQSYDLGPAMAKGLSLHIVFMLIPMIHDRGRERHGEILQGIADLVASGRLRPLLDPRRFTLAEAGEAHRHLESGRAVGKVVIDVSDQAVSREP
jgi:NADPH2:quinone reductase